MARRTVRLALLALALPPILALAGCSDRPAPADKERKWVGQFRVVKFAGEKVVIPFRDGLSTATVAEPSLGGDAPKAGDRVVLADIGEGEVFAALDLDALRFYHSSPTADQVGRFRLLGQEGRLFVVPRGTIGKVTQVLKGGLPDGLDAVEVELAGSKGGAAWVGEPFVRQAGK